MNTFLEFYLALVRFINFKLFKDLAIHNYEELANREILDSNEIAEL